MVTVNGGKRYINLDRTELVQNTDQRARFVLLVLKFWTLMPQLANLKTQLTSSYSSAFTY
jgi:hypothetical protein